MTFAAAESTVAACFSRPLRLVEWARYIVVDDEQDCMPDLDANVEGRPYLSLRNKWVYVFQRLGAETRCFDEVFVDPAGQIFPGSAARPAKEEAADRPGPDQAAGGLFSLPHTICGKRAHYAFFVSRIRLPLGTIDVLVSHVGGLLPLVDLSSPTPLGAASDGAWLLGVLDPITIALDLHQQYVEALDDRIGFATPHRGQSVKAQEQASERQHLYLIARALQDIMDNDQEDKSGVRGVIQDDGQAAAKYIHDYHENLRLLKQVAESRAGELTRWIGGKLMTLVREASAERPREHFAHYLDLYAAFTGRLAQSDEGNAYIDRVLADKDHFIHKYVIPGTAQPDEVFATVRKCVQSIVGIWEHVAENRLQKLKSRKIIVETVRVTLVAPLERALRVRLVYAGNVTRMAWRLQGRSYVRVTVTYKKLLVLPRPTPHRWAMVALDRSAIGKVKHLVLSGIEIINLALAVGAVCQRLADGSGGDGWDALNVAGAVMDAYTAWGQALRGRPQASEFLRSLTTKRLLALIGAASAVVDAILAGRSAVSAFSKQDYSVGAGYVLVSIGSLAIAAGTFLARTPQLYFMIAGAILIVGGWLLATLTKDAPIKIFAGHCFFGVHRHAASADAEEPWCGSLATLASDPARQVAAIFQIASAFTVQTKRGDLRTVRIYLGMTHPDSRLHVRFSSAMLFSEVHQPRLYIELASRSMELEGGDAADLGRIAFGEEAGRPFVDVGGYLPDGQMREILNNYCWIYLESATEAAEAPMRIPSPDKNGRPRMVQYMLSSLSMVNVAHVSSLDPEALVLDKAAPGSEVSAEEKQQ